MGNPVGGVGAEIALQPLNLLVQPVVPGATMRGPRQGGFGALNDRTFEICAPNDAICDAPREIGNALGRATEMVQANGVHSVYATNPYVIPDTTANQWVVEWAKGSLTGNDDVSAPVEVFVPPLVVGGDGEHLVQLRVLAFD